MQETLAQEVSEVMIWAKNLLKPIYSYADFAHGWFACKHVYISVKGSIREWFTNCLFMVLFLEETA